MKFYLILLIIISNLFSQNFKPENNVELNYRQLEFSWPQVPNSDSYQLTITDMDTQDSYIINNEHKISGAISFKEFEEELLTLIKSKNS